MLLVEANPFCDELKLAEVWIKVTDFAYPVFPVLVKNIKFLNFDTPLGTKSK